RQLAHGGGGAMRADVAHHQRIAVRCRTRGRHRTDDPAAAALILDHDRLAENLAQSIAHPTCYQVDATARLHGRDDLDRPRRIGILGQDRECEPEGGDRADRSQTNQQSASPHADMPFTERQTAENYALRESGAGSLSVRRRTSYTVRVVA